MPSITAPTRLSLNAQEVVKKRYSRRNGKGEQIEDWSDIVHRVVSHVAQAEKQSSRQEQFHRAMLEIMLNRKFIPNTPCLVNAGSPKAQLASCFVLPVPDSLDGIMEHAKQCALIHKSGGGCGMTYERLRPAGAPISGGRGFASGPVSFMQIVNTVTETVKQGGVRRGANMGCLSVAHPDILRFIHAKNDQKSLTNFNISVTVTDEFLKAVENNEWFQTEFDDKPWTEPVYDPKANNGEGGDYMYEGPDGSKKPPRPGLVFAPDIWHRIIVSTHTWAEPGIIFIDNVNRHNPLMRSIGPKKASNPCGEEMLHDTNACNLGSIDVAKYYNEATDDLDWGMLAYDIYWCVRFLDNVIDVCAWPLPEIAETVYRTRPVGLGIMGFADLLLHKRIAYGSEESASFADRLMAFIREEGWKTSLALGAEKGVMPELEPNRDLYEQLIYREVGLDAAIPLTPRNYEVTTIAPTGTISLVAETSSGCEPNFSYAYVRRDTLGTRVYAHPLAAKALGIEFDPTDAKSVERAAHDIQKRRHELPEHFVDAMALTSDDHLRVLKALQDHVDNSISKTCNAPSSYTVEDTDRVHRLAWKLGVKAISFYRDGSRDGQVLTVMTSAGDKAVEDQREKGCGEQGADNLVSNVNGRAAATRGEGMKVRAATYPLTQGLSDSASQGESLRIARPRELSGATWVIPFEGQKLFVTVNHDHARVLEVFCAGPVSPGVGMLASKMLRGSFTASEVARCLNKITSTHSVWFNQRLITSPEQAIAECILITLRRLEGKKDAPAKAASQFADADGHPSALAMREPIAQSPGRTCPECGGEQLLRNGGCDYCPACGWSKCK